MGTMSDLPEVRPLAPPVTGDDVASALLGLEPGWYRSSALLPRYLVWAKANGKPEITAKTLGEIISRTWPGTARRRIQGGVSAWWLDEATLKHRAWFK
jgi:hypothetical protein